MGVLLQLKSQQYRSLGTCQLERSVGKFVYNSTGSCHIKTAQPYLNYFILTKLTQIMPSPSDLAPSGVSVGPIILLLVTTAGFL